MAGSLADLSNKTIDQNALLNDLKALVGKQYYEETIRNLQSAIEEAQRRACAPSLFSLISAL